MVAVSFASLRKKLETYLSVDQIDLIHRAYLFASRAHRSQQRVSGERYITHPLAVADILADMHMDAPSIAAALLHDIIEDTPIDHETLAKKFGEEITKLVEGVSKLTQIKFESHIEAQAENFRKMMMAMVDDIRVILIKMADRLHNMRTLHSLKPHKQKRIAKETLEIYAPIANRLGMHNFRIEFEELGFQTCYPMRYRVLKEAVKKARGNRKEILSVIEQALHERLKEAKFRSYQLIGREKHLYSIYGKMRSKHLPFVEIMDIYAFRIIVETLDECYRTLGLVHRLYKPIPRRFKDYIAIPKVNGYQSIHTVLFGPYGVPIEIQIRTEAMDKMAEQGIAAHWLYKSEENIVDQSQVRAREWIKGLLEIQQSAGDSLEFIENVKIDLFPDEIYVFTPQGKIMELPAGATAVDFAYQVHSEIGRTCVAAKINRRLMPLNTVLRNGQTVEIVTSVTATPNPAWLNFVVTGNARSKIRYFLKHQLKEESIALGKRLLIHALNSYHQDLSTLSEQHKQKGLARLHLKNMDELYAELGLGNQIAQIAAHHLMNETELSITGAQDELHKEPLHIKGSEGVVITFAKCCRPIPGDPIEGVLTAGQGIVVHHRQCKNLNEWRATPDKCIPLAWAEDIHAEFEVELFVEILNVRGVLANIAITVADNDANIEHVRVEEKPGQSSTITLILTVHDRAHLLRIIQQLSQVKNVVRVVRHQSF